MSFQQLGTNERPFTIGHRGGAGPALENSLSAFRNAAGAGPWRCDGVELDIHVTSDGEFVVHHDPLLRSGTRIRELSLASIREQPLSDGSSIPTLGEVFSIIGKVAVFVEVKELPPEADGPLLRLLAAAAEQTRIQVHSFDHRIVARLKQSAPGITTGVLSSSYPIDPLDQVRAAKADTLWQSLDLIDVELVQSCAREGISLVAWTVNVADDAQRLHQMGVTALCGDWPDRLRQGS